MGIRSALAKKILKRSFKPVLKKRTLVYSTIQDANFRNGITHDSELMKDLIQVRAQHFHDERARHLAVKSVLKKPTLKGIRTHLLPLIQKQEKKQ
ncbi:MAG: hypothetical protein WCW44_04450 [archaeon]|jgi:hypothetical protein